MGQKGYIMQVQPFSVNDGDGIRTTIFMAGCPMRCAWCSNPEGFSREPLIGFYSRKCVNCGACAKACPEGIDIDLNAERGNCASCGACVKVCPTGARAFMVREVDSDDIITEIQKHRLFYSYSGGGITFSGGEATSQPKFLNCLTEQIYDLGYSMAIETCGHFDFDNVRPSLERMDLIFMDLKLIDDERHRMYTGVSNAKTLENMVRLRELNADVVIRIPVIGGVNADEDNIRRSAEFVRCALPNARLELLPYHRLGSVKYEAIGMPYERPDFYRPSEEEMERFREIVRSEGVRTADFR